MVLLSGRQPLLAILLATASSLLFEAAQGKAIRWTDPPEGVFEDEWYTIEMMDQPIGYAHATLSRQGDFITAEREETMKLGRAEASISITQSSSSRETLKGEPVSFSVESNQSMRTMRTEGTIKDGKIRATVRQMDREVIQEFDYPVGALMTWGLFLLEREKGLTPGTQYSTTAFLPEMSLSASVSIKVSVLAVEEIEAQGEKRQAAQVVSTVGLPGVSGSVTSTEWVDLREEVVLKTMTEMMGAQLVMTRCSREIALRDFEPQEAFMRSLVPAGASIDSRSAKSITYRLSIPKQEPLNLPVTGMQTILSNQNGIAEVVVERQDLESLQTRDADEKPTEDIAPYLKPNAYLNSDDPAVIAVAREAQGTEKDPLRIALQLRAYVHGAIRNTNLDVGYATASEVCQDRQGDCTEYAVLLACLGRACSLPTRVVAGLVYVSRVGSQADVFGFHMWTQFLIRGQWIDLDATVDEPGCNPTHIAFSASSLMGQNVGELVFPLANAIGQLKLEILKASPEGSVSKRTTGKQAG